MSMDAAKRFFFLGLDALEQEEFSNAEKYLRNSLALLPSRRSTLVNLSIACLKQNKLQDAYQFASEATTVDQFDANSLNQLAMVLIEMKRGQEASDVLESILRTDPQYVDALVNKGKLLYELMKFSEAIECFSLAMSIDNSVIEAFIGLGSSLFRIKEIDKALSVFQHAHSKEPRNPVLLNAYANLLKDINRYDDALQKISQALRIKPKYSEALNNMGIILSIIGRNEEAVTIFDKAIELNAEYAEAYYNKGVAFQELKKTVNAISCYERALQINPHAEVWKGALIHAKMYSCAWGQFDEEIVKLMNDVFAGKYIVQPFCLIALTDSPSAHFKAAQTFASKQEFAIGQRPLLSGGAKIKIGFVSSDFRNHPMPQVIGEIIERHDRSRFIVCGFSLLPDDGSSMSANIRGSFDEFYDCHLLHSGQVQDMIRRAKIDILIDLNGYTNHSRPEIFAGRPAPIQVSYIGYVGTMGVDFIDYMIGDKIVFPEGAADYYSEKLVRMPNSYYCRDRRLKPSSAIQKRIDHRLPDDRFVFCCFNGAYKILPSMFDCWMRILKSVDGSVLWLLNDHPAATKNLQLEAEARGVSSERIVFAPKMSLPDHLARHSCADLFLDTLPCNAHTTASDALWAGLPVLTHCGEAFAGRVAASLLNAVGLPELITRSEAEYETMAIRLAKDPDELATLRRRLAQNKLSSKLFDTPLYVKHLESAFEAMYERYQSGLPPDHIYVNE